jgi:hypothetical protein
MKSVSANYPVLLIGILIGLAGGIVVGMWAPPATFKVPAECGAGGFWCFVDRWQPILAGILALIGAGFAWFAIDRQIKAHREENRLTASQTESILEAELFDLLSELNQAWRILDTAFDESQSEDEKRKANNIARSQIGVSLMASRILKRQDLTAQLLPMDREYYDKIFFSISGIRKELDWQKSEEGQEEAVLDRSITLLIHLSHLAKILETSSGSLKEIFLGRKHTAVIHTPTWHALKTVADKWVEEHQPRS